MDISTCTTLLWGVHLLGVKEMNVTGRVSSRPFSRMFSRINLSGARTRIVGTSGGLVVATWHRTWQPQPQAGSGRQGQQGRGLSLETT